MGALVHYRWRWLRRVFSGLGTVASPSARDDGAPAWRVEPEPAPPEFRIAVGSLVHELRVPLAALSGEVELALLRDRSPAAYREALARIGARVADLIRVTDDLAVLGHPADDDVLLAQTAHVADVFEGLIGRLGSISSAGVHIDTPAAGMTVRGDEMLLARALALLIEHALKRRPHGGTVSLGARRSSDGASIDLILEAPPVGFSRETWRHLTAHARDGSIGSSSWPFGLLTASHIVHRHGGSVSLAGADDSAYVRIRLPGASDGAHVSRVTQAQSR